MALRTWLLVLWVVGVSCERTADYSGFKVLSITPNTVKDVAVLRKLTEDFKLDLWNAPRQPGVPVMTHLKPSLQKHVEDLLNETHIPYSVAFADLQSAINHERLQHAPTNASFAEKFDFSRFNRLEQVEGLLKDLAAKYPKLAKLETIGKSFENRPIYVLKISNGDGSNKPAIMLECGIHAREWASVATGAYLVNRLITTYGSDPEVTSLLDKHEFSVVVEANPDGYVYTWNHNRMWRKTRSTSTSDWRGVCKGTDANRNFDVDHCGVGTSRSPCEETFCGDKPFSESEARALRDLLVSLKGRVKAYFSVHAFSQLWMTPYGTSKSLPPNYGELSRVGQAGVNALAKKYGTQYRLGSIANIIYLAAGSSVDYFYIKHDVKIAYALELRDKGRYGFLLPQNQILPTCEETYDGLVAAINAI